MLLRRKFDAYESTGVTPSERQACSGSLTTLQEIWDKHKLLLKLKTAWTVTKLVSMGSECTSVDIALARFSGIVAEDARVHVDGAMIIWQTAIEKPDYQNKLLGIEIGEELWSSSHTAETTLKKVYEDAAYLMDDKFQQKDFFEWRESIESLAIQLAGLCKSFDVARPEGFGKLLEKVVRAKATAAEGRILHALKFETKSRPKLKNKIDGLMEKTKAEPWPCHAVLSSAVVAFAAVASDMEDLNFD